MTVAIIAKYPWNEVKAISTDEVSKVFVFTDSRVSYKKQPLPQYQEIKQFTLANNLAVCFASSHLYATDEALQKKSNDPSTSSPDSQASERDVNRLGRMLLEQHETRQLGGFSDVLAALWPRGSTIPKLYQLMPPDYEPAEREGIVGVGNYDVLMKFKGLLPDQFKRQRLTSDDPQFDRELWKQVMFAVHVSFVEALLDTRSSTADVPITGTLLDKEGITPTPQSAVLTSMNQLLHVTEFTKPGFDGKERKIEPYTDGPRNAVQLFT